MEVWMDKIRVKKKKMCENLWNKEIALEFEEAAAVRTDKSWCRNI